MEYGALRKIINLQKVLNLDPEDREYHRIFISYVFLSATAVIFIVFSIINIFIFDQTLLGLIQIILTPVCFIAIIFLKKTGNIDATAWVATIIPAIFLLMFVLTSEAHSSTIALAAVFPGVVFFLLGHRIGIVFLGLFFPALGLMFWWNIETNADQISNPIVVVNTILIIALITVQVFAYEFSRKQAFDKNVEVLDRLKVLSTTDSLTGLWNRRTTEQLLEDEIARSQRHHSKLTMAIIDIDHFKQVNDTYGHNGGDTVLKEIAAEFQRIIRSYDIIGRWGGEEFVVICPETGRDVATELFDRMRRHIEEHIFSNGVKLTISIGTAEYRDSDSPSSLAIRADKAMYQAKHSGRNRVCTD